MELATVRQLLSNQGNQRKKKGTARLYLRRLALLIELGAVHILCQPKTGVPTPPLPPPPSVSNGQHLADPPSPLRQQWSAFSLPPLVSLRQHFPAGPIVQQFST